MKHFQFYALCPVLGKKNEVAYNEDHRFIMTT